MLKVKFDWLEFTILDTSLLKTMELVNLEFEDFSELSTGRFGYHNQYKWQGGHIYVMFTALDPGEKIDETSRINLRSGVHIMITGQGCKQYSADHDLLGLIKQLSELEKINFSRIDVAIDDFTSKIINYDRIHQAALEGTFTSRWSKWDEVNSRQTADNTFLGRTMYFGAQASDLFCRIYDKTLERKVNAKEEKTPQKWTRLELVYKKDRARKLVDYLIKEKIPLGHIVRGTLKQYMRFLIRATDQNKARWPTALWWDELLKDVDALKLTIEKESRTIEDMLRWVDQQISPTLSTIIQAHQGDMAWFKYILVKGGERLSQKHKDAIKQYQLAKEQGV